MIRYLGLVICSCTIGLKSVQLPISNISMEESIMDGAVCTFCIDLIIVYWNMLSECSCRLAFSKASGRFSANHIIFIRRMSKSRWSYEIEARDFRKDFTVAPIPPFFYWNIFPQSSVFSVILCFNELDFWKNQREIFNVEPIDFSRNHLELVFYAPNSKLCSMKRSHFESVIASSQISSTSNCSVEEDVHLSSSPTLPSDEDSRVLDLYEFQAFLSADVVHKRAVPAPSAAATSRPVFSAMFGSRMFDPQVLRLILRNLFATADGTSRCQLPGYHTTTHPSKTTSRAWRAGPVRCSAVQCELPECKQESISTDER